MTIARSADGVDLFCGEPFVPCSRPFHGDSVLALRIVFSICLVIVLVAGAYIFRIRKRPSIEIRKWWPIIGRRATCASGR